MDIISDAARERQRKLIDEFLLDLRALDKSEETIKTYKAILYCANRELPNGVLCSTDAEIKEFIFRPERKPRTKSTYRAAFAAIYDWGTNPLHPTVDYNPMQNVPKVSVKAGSARPAPKEQLQSAMEQAPMPKLLWLALATGMGLRCVEISRSDREHFTEERTWLRGKGGKDSYVTTHPLVWDLVKGLPPGPIARNSQGGRATPKEVQQRANYYLRRFGGLTMHMLRHYFGTNVWKTSGRDILVTQRAMRHANPNTTRAYIADEPQALASAIHAVTIPGL